jgi:hypothetical protein
LVTRIASGEAWAAARGSLGIGSVVAVTEPSDLYGLPREGFVPARLELAKAMRKEGRREEAGVVASLGKPSVAAWAVNQLVRTRARDIAALFAAGDVLEHAQSELLAGRGDATALREAVARERDAASKLGELARGLLSSDGHQPTPTTLARVSESLHAAALDADARAQVKDGCLVREVRHIGLGQSSVGSQPASGSRSRTQPPARRKAAKPRPSMPSKATTKGARASEAALHAEKARTERERATRLKAARKAEADARRAAERAEGELHSAQVRRDDAADALRKAEAGLAAAREKAERARLEHQRAVQSLERL